MVLVDINFITMKFLVESIFFFLKNCTTANTIV